MLLEQSLQNPYHVACRNAAGAVDLNAGLGALVYDGQTLQRSLIVGLVKNEVITPGPPGALRGGGSDGPVRD